MGNLDFDAEKVEPKGTYEVIPKGDHPLYVAESEIEQTKDARNGVAGCQNDKFLKLKIQVADGSPYEKKTFFVRLNLWNKNQQAVDIAKAELSALCRAIGKMQVQNHEDLKFKKFLGSLDIEVDGNFTNNVIKKYSPIDAVPATQDGKAVAPW